MDEKTEQLRDIFMSVSDDETVTEQQEAGRGSLASERSETEQLAAVVERMRERYDFSTSLSDAELATVVRGFYEGLNDTEIARDLGDASLSKTVSRARIDLHLVTEADRDAPFDLPELESRLGDRPMIEIAEELGVSESTIRRYRRIIEVQSERKVAGDRFREEFERILEDRELEERFTEETRRTGLEDATEGMETNVSF